VFRQIVFRQLAAIVISHVVIQIAITVLVAVLLLPEHVTIL